VTSVADSVLLCWHDHDWVHANEVTIHRQDDRWLFADRDGLPIR
jgi:hypothetical protein